MSFGIKDHVGLYSLCVLKKGQNIEQCYELTIEAAESLTGKISIEKNKLTVAIDQGSPSFWLLKMAH